MKTTLDRWHAQYILEALRVCGEQWLKTARASDDEDLQADYGNDLVRLHMIQEFLERESVEAFGPGVKEFSREPLVAALTKP